MRQEKSWKLAICSGRERWGSGPRKWSDPRSWQCTGSGGTDSKSKQKTGINPCCSFIKFWGLEMRKEEERGQSMMKSMFLPVQGEIVMLSN